MKTIEGDLIQLAKDGHFEVIVHGCNCFCTMGSGIAKAIKSEFPEAFEADRKTDKGNKSKLGSFSQALHQVNGHTVAIVNAYTQFDWRGKGLKADYEAIRQVFKRVKSTFPGKSIGFPLIGAGLAGGDWRLISEIIEQELKGEDFALVKLRSVQSRK